MSTKRFDKQIKKKLESVRPPYTEGAWANFQSMVPVPWHAALLQKYGSLLYGSATSIALVVITLLYFQERSENNQLQTQLTALQAGKALPDTLHSAATERLILPSADDKTLSHLSPSQPTAGVAPDTIYLVKKIFVKNNATTATDIPSLNKQQANSTYNGQNNSNSNQNRSSLDATAVISNSQTDNKLASSTTSDSSIQINNRLTTLTNSDSTQSIAAIDSLEQASEGAAAKKDSSQSSFSKLHGRIGFGANAARGEIAFSPLAEIFLSKNLSLQIGLQLDPAFKESFRDRWAYNQQKGRLFEEDYPNRVPYQRFVQSIDNSDTTYVMRHDSIYNINLSTNTIRLPLSLNYYFPLKSYFSFMTMVGTTLDLAVHQKVNFQSPMKGFIQFETKPTPVYFNNMTYGVGIQYTFKRFVFQAVPFYHLQFREVDYRKTPPKVGVHASIKFNL